MFSWYRKSNLTVAYLSDVAEPGSLSCSTWLTRGWTLPELLAPQTMLFFAEDWSPYMGGTPSNHKTDPTVLHELQEATGIAPEYLVNFYPGSADARLRLQWASMRRTSRPEDIAYALFGIFQVHLPVLYGESAERALGRLLAEIISQSGDVVVLDWVGEVSSFHSCFPASITSYAMLPSAQPSSSQVESPALVPKMWQRVSQKSTRSMYRALSNLPLPQFMNRRLILPCIIHRVKLVQLMRVDPGTACNLYQIQAVGLRPLEITSLARLQEGSGRLERKLPYILVRPWCSRLLELDDEWLSQLERPFYALLLTELPHNEFKRIVSSCLINACPAGSAGILRSGVGTLTVV
ncbi:hypothetical protein BKA83DRAFT_4268259 [Pisolithus microcarpus]|nr:hypothetical protein BKA83DRAFT_4268259 [Pisolithus microcarpus]